MESITTGKIAKNFKKPENLTIKLNDREQCKINQTVLLAQLQKSLADKEVNLPLTLEQQINTLAFSSVNSSKQAALEEWKKSLATLLNEVDNDQKKLKVVEEYIEETQKVIRAVDSFISLNANDDKSDKVNDARDALLVALESFQEKVLQISDNEMTLHIASGFLGMVVGAVIGGIIAAFVLSGVPAILTFFALVLVGMMVSHYCVGNAIGADAVNPEQKNSISNKLTEFGIFGNTPKHKARHFLDVIKEENGLKSSEVSRTTMAQQELGREIMFMAPMMSY